MSVPKRIARDDTAISVIVPTPQKNIHSFVAVDTGWPTAPLRATRVIVRSRAGMTASSDTNAKDHVYLEQAHHHGGQRHYEQERGEAELKRTLRLRLCRPVGGEWG